MIYKEDFKIIFFGGDLFSFVQQIEGVDFIQALEQLAEKAGIELEKKDYDPTSLKKKKIYEINQITTAFYQQLLKHPSAKDAQKYLREKRKLTEQTISEFKIGYAPKTYDLLFKFLIKKGYNTNEIFEAGVITKRQNQSGYIDKFRNRILFIKRFRYTNGAAFK